MMISITKCIYKLNSFKFDNGSKVNKVKNKDVEQLVQIK